MKENNQNLLNMSIGKSLTILAIPIIIANALQSSYFLANAFWVGKLGEHGAATIAISGVIIFMTISIGLGLSIAGSILISQYFGAKNWQKINHIRAQSTILMLLVSIIISIFGIVFSPQIAMYVGASPDILPEVISFLKITFWGLGFSFIYIMFQSIMRSIGRPNLPIVIILVTLAISIVLNPVLIFNDLELSNMGAFGSFILKIGGGYGMGVDGAAYTTLITQALASLIGMMVMFSGKFDIKISFRDFVPDLAKFKKMFLLGWPASVEILTISATFVLLTSIVAHYGDVAIAGFGASRNIMQFLLVFSTGIGIANTVLIGQAIGSNQIERAKSINKFSAIIAFIIMFVSGILRAVFAPFLLDKLFLPGQTGAIEIGTNMLHIFAPFFGFIGLQMAFSGTIRAVGKTHVTMIVTLISWILIIIPARYMLSNLIGINGIWWANPIGEVIGVAMIYGVFRKIDWSKANITEEKQNIDILQIKKEVRIS